jgi:hypothetical protein
MFTVIVLWQQRHLQGYFPSVPARLFAGVECCCHSNGGDDFSMVHAERVGASPLDYLQRWFLDGSMRGQCELEMHWWDESEHPSGSAADNALYERMGESNYMALKRRRAIAFIESHPGGYALRSMRRVVFMWTGIWVSVTLSTRCS